MISQLMHSKLLIFLWNKTKELMILHYPPFYYTVVLRYIIGKSFKPNIIGAIIITVITIVCCLSNRYVYEQIKNMEICNGKIGENRTPAFTKIESGTVVER